MTYDYESLNEFDDMHVHELECRQMANENLAAIQEYLNTHTIEEANAVREFLQMDPNYDMVKNNVTPSNEFWLGILFSMFAGVHAFASDDSERDGVTIYNVAIFKELKTPYSPDAAAFTAPLGTRRLLKYPAIQECVKSITSALSVFESLQHPEQITIEVIQRVDPYIPIPVKYDTALQRRIRTGFNYASVIGALALSGISLFTGVFAGVVTDVLAGGYVWLTQLIKRKLFQRIEQSIIDENHFTPQNCGYTPQNVTTLAPQLLALYARIDRLGKRLFPKIWNYSGDADDIGDMMADWPEELENAYTRFNDTMWQIYSVLYGCAKSAYVIRNFTNIKQTL